eukprot:s94_g15.t1
MVRRPPRLACLFQYRPPEIPTRRSLRWSCAVLRSPCTPAAHPQMAPKDPGQGSGGGDRPISPRSSRQNAAKPKPQNKNRKQLPLYIRVSRTIVDNTYFMVFTTILTFYALTADDLRTKP